MKHIVNCLVAAVVITAVVINAKAATAQARLPQCSSATKLVNGKGRCSLKSAVVYFQGGQTTIWVEILGAPLTPNDLHLVAKVAKKPIRIGCGDVKKPVTGFRKDFFLPVGTCFLTNE